MTETPLTDPVIHLKDIEGRNELLPASELVNQTFGQVF